MSTIPDRCSLRSLAAHEALAGTASTIRRWLLVEHLGPWGEVALRDAPLVSGARERLRAWERATRGRVLLIRRAGRDPSGPTPACLAVDTRRARAGSRSIDGLENLAGLDLEDAHAFSEPVTGPVIVVCTHGRRDVCCAERGRPLAAAAAAALPGGVWESTHVGGDRFAGNLVAFPHGLYFGRIEPDRAAEVVHAYGEGRIVLDRYRGRSCDPLPVQAGDQAVRSRFGLEAIDDVRPLRVSRDADRVSMTFATSRGEVDAMVERDRHEPMRLTCRADRAQAPTAWRVTSVDPAG